MRNTASSSTALAGLTETGMIQSTALAKVRYAPPGRSQNVVSLSSRKSLSATPNSQQTLAANPVAYEIPHYTLLSPNF